MIRCNADPTPYHFHPRPETTPPPSLVAPPPSLNIVGRCARTKENDMASTVYWQREGLADELAEALATLAEEYPLKEREGSPSIEFSKQGEPGTLEVARR
jgi:hypothetical protein